MRLLPAVFVLFAPAAFAQDGDSVQNDLEYRQSDIERSNRKVDVSTQFESQWHEYNNLDFRPLDESSDQAILDSDDRGAFAFTGLGLDIDVEMEERTNLVLGVSHRGLWGNDQLGSTNTFGGWVYFTTAHLDHTTPAGTRIRVGRQFFEPGANGGSREYILSDILDMVRIDHPIGEIGEITLIPIDVVGASVNPDDVQLIRYVGQSQLQSFNFRGDRMSRRHGAMLTLDGLKEGLDLRAYGFYTDVGALGTGSDITYNGRLGNFSDQDWVANVGVRGQFDAGTVTPFATFDYSLGADRKELVARDANANGFAASAGLAIDTTDPEAEVEKGFKGEVSGFYALGAAYDDTGLLGSHGFVGMKARHTGGTILNRYIGMHPTAYIGMFGVSDTQHDYDRKSGTMVAHARGTLFTGSGLSLGLSVWHLQDTGVTGITEFDEVDELDPPYGYSREEFYAQERLGRAIGQEVNLDVGYELTEGTSILVNGAVFLPGSFYALPIGRVVGTALGGQAMAWSVNGGLRVRF